MWWLRRGMFTDRFLQARIMTRPFLSVSLFVRSLVTARPLSGARLVIVRSKRTAGLGTAAAASAKAAADDRTSLSRRVWALALPAIGEQLLALFVGLSDTFLTGHLSSYATAHLGYGQADAVSAVGVASTAVWVVLTSFFAINIGVTALV